MSNPRRTLNLSDEVWQRLRLRAVVEGRSASDVAEEVLDEYLVAPNGKSIWAPPATKSATPVADVALDRKAANLAKVTAALGRSKHAAGVVTASMLTERADDSDEPL